MDRAILWSRLRELGVGDEFISALQSLYEKDCVSAVVNGLPTRTIYLKKGLRQGCSLSPLLFALYVSEVANTLAMAEEGFKLGSQIISSLFFAGHYTGHVRN